MKLLILGGTRFLGRHIVESAIARGHEITLFHRGNTNPGLFDVEEILGDRDGEMGKLAGRDWNAVVDTCGYYPRVVEQSARTLCGHIGLYCFISTISVYKDGQDIPWDESSEVLRFDGDLPAEEITAEAYGPFKVLCEETVSDICGSAKSLIIRPGLIVGPHDPSDRFTYWVDRFCQSEPILIPDRGDQTAQVIDARDLADFAVSAVERQLTGVFNTTGPGARTTMGDLWSICREECKGRPEEVAATDEFLTEHEVQEWMDLPLILPRADRMEVSSDAAIAEGLVYRPLRDTVRDTAEWHRSRGDIPLKTGLSRERERELVELLRQAPVAQ